MMNHRCTLEGMTYQQQQKLKKKIAPARSDPGSEQIEGAWILDRMDSDECILRTSESPIIVVYDFLEMPTWPTPRGAQVPSDEAVASATFSLDRLAILHPSTYHFPETGPVLKF